MNGVFGRGQVLGHVQLTVKLLGAVGHQEKVREGAQKVGVKPLLVADIIVVGEIKAVGVAHRHLLDRKDRDIGGKRRIDLYTHTVAEGGYRA